MNTAQALNHLLQNPPVFPDTRCPEMYLGKWSGFYFYMQNSREGKSISRHYPNGSWASEVYVSTIEQSMDGQGSFRRYSNYNSAYEVAKALDYL